MRQVTVLGPEGRRIPRGKIVVEGGIRVWECRVHESKHLYRNLDAWTVGGTVLRQLQDNSADLIRYVVTDRDGESYEVSLAKFIQLAEPLDQSGWRQQTEEQYALPRRYWEKKQGSAVRQLAFVF